LYLLYFIKLLDLSLLGQTCARFFSHSYFGDHLRQRDVSEYSQAVEGNSIAERVFLRILQQEDDVAPILPEQEQALFLQLFEKTPVNDTSDRLCGLVDCDGQDELYFDVLPEWNHQSSGVDLANVSYS